MTVQTEQREVRALPSHRRRVWSLEEKQRIVGESLEPGASVSLVARRHDINTNMLFTWRRQLGGGEAAGGQPVTFVPAEITAEVSAARIAETPQSLLSELLPWNWMADRLPRAAA